MARPGDNHELVAPHDAQAGVLIQWHRSLAQPGRSALERPHRTTYGMGWVVRGGSVPETGAFISFCECSLGPSPLGSSHRGSLGLFGLRNERTGVFLFLLERR